MAGHSFNTLTRVDTCLTVLNALASVAVGLANIDKPGSVLDCLDCDIHILLNYAFGQPHVVVCVCLTLPSRLAHINHGNSCLFHSLLIIVLLPFPQSVELWIPAHTE